MTMPFSQFAAAGTIAPDEVLALRRAVWADGAISTDEGEALIALNARITQPSPEWRDFFVEALTVLLTEQTEPRGYVTPEQADWLVTRLGLAAPTPAAIELLVHLSERATSVPAILRSFALERIETTILDRDPDGQRRVSADEVRWLRRLIFAPGSDGPASVARTEAEALFRIKDATLGAGNAPEWQQLFVQGVGNYLQGLGGAEAPSREREAELDRFMAAPEGGTGSFMGKMARGLFQSGNFETALTRPVSHGRDWDEEARRAAAVTSDEADWLKARIEADGARDPLEQALVDFLRRG